MILHFPFLRLIFVSLFSSMGFYLLDSVRLSVWLCLYWLAPRVHLFFTFPNTSFYFCFSLTSLRSIFSQQFRYNMEFTLSGSVTRLGDLLNFGQVFKAFGNNQFISISHIFRQFCKVVKIYHFWSEIILGNFYRYLTIFFWSHCTGGTMIDWTPPKNEVEKAQEWAAN